MSIMFTGELLTLSMQRIKCTEAKNPLVIMFFQTRNSLHEVYNKTLEVSLLIGLEWLVIFHLTHWFFLLTRPK